MGPAAKRRKLETSKTEEVVFDNTARHDYLTGFHKRKVQRTKLARETAIKKARQEKIESRKKIREQRKADLEQHVKEVNRLLHPNGDDKEDEADLLDKDESGEDSSGTDEMEPVAIDHENEYVDEEKYTTVTVEEINVTRDGLFKTEQENEGTVKGNNIKSDTDKSQSESAKSKTDVRNKKPSKERSQTVKKKRKKFRYESKADRTKNHLKARAKNSKQARARKNG